MSSSNKNESSVFSMIKLGLILAAFSLVSCTLLALVNNATSPVIAENEKQTAFNAMSSVFNQADSFEEVKNVDFLQFTQGTTVKIKSIYLAKKDGQTIGSVVQAKGPTYDTAEIMIGINKENVVTGLEFLSITDSPGFGQKAKDPKYTVKNGKTFYGQFTGLDASLGFTTGENIDAIAGATITSDGVALIAGVAAKAAMGVIK
jgi:Na+-translocating ferredoxin:NAD+ oxidoreductase subunit G